MHNDNVLAMRFTEQHITPAALTLSAALFILHPSCSCYSVLSSPLFCFSLCSYFFSLTPTHLSFTLSTQLHFSCFFFFHFFSCKDFCFPSTPPLCDISLSPAIIVLRFTSTSWLHLPPSFPVLVFPSAFRGLQIPP